MKKTSKLLLGLSYVAGFAMALNFMNKKTKTGSKKVDWKDSLKAFVRKFATTHRNAFETAKEEYWTDANKAKLEQLVKEFRQDGRGKIAELITQGKHTLANRKTELTRWYDEKLSSFEKAQVFGAQAWDVVSGRLESTWKQLQKELTTRKAPAAKKSKKAKK